MSDVVGVAVVGAGPAGQAHAFGLRNATMSDALSGLEVQLIAVVDPDLNLAQMVARRYGFEQALTSIDELLIDARVTAVCVAVPNFLTVEIVEKLLRAGKAVLAEKPLGISASQAADLADLAAASGAVTGVGFSYRRIPALAEARELIAAGAVGVPYFAVARFFADYALDPMAPMSWRFSKETSGGGALFDMGTHVIDAVEFLLGPVSEVSSAVMNTVVVERPTADGSGTGQVDNDDTVIATLRHHGGAISSLVVSRIASGKPCEMGVTVFGSQGYVSFDFSRIGEIEVFEEGASPRGLDGPRRVISGPSFPGYSDVMPMAFRGNTAGYGEAFIAQAQAFLACVREGRPMDTSFDVAVQTMQVAEAIVEADRTCGPVTLGEPVFGSAQ